MNKIGCDIDGVLADFNLAYGKLFIEIGKENRFGENWQERLAATEFPLSWDWETQAGYSPETIRAVWDHIKRSEKFWMNLTTYPGTERVIKRLNQMANGGSEVYFLTNRMGEKAKLQTEKWLYNLGVNYPTVIVASDKLPIIQSLSLNFFIDDKPETIQAISEANLPDLKLWLRKHPYNEGVYKPNVLMAATVEDALAETYGL